MGELTWESYQEIEGSAPLQKTPAEPSLTSSITYRCQESCAFLGNIPVREAPPFASQCTECYSKEIIEGKLECSRCVLTFPIINGVPRLLPPSLSHLIPQYHQDFFRRFPSLCPPSPEERNKRSATEATLRSFSFQWTTFSQMFPAWKAFFFDYIHPITSNFFPGKTGLDAGCGYGRYMVQALEAGSEMIGIDLSEAVQEAYKLTSSFPLAHLIQGDLFHLPLKKRRLDFAYSIGVLQLLPDPAGGFRELVQLVKPGGHIFIWVYGSPRPFSYTVILALRKLTTHLPFPLLYILTWLLSAITYYPASILKKIPGLAPFGKLLPRHSYTAYPFQVSWADLFDALSVPIVHLHSKEEVQGWFQEAALENILITWKPKGSWRGLGKVPVRNGSPA